MKLRNAFIERKMGRGIGYLFNLRVSEFFRIKSICKTSKQQHTKMAFTLAEVLITLGIIGIVVALTIPALIQNYQNRAWNTSSTVFESKLEEALKVMNTQQVLAGYKTTEDFVNELQKHLKIIKIGERMELPLICRVSRCRHIWDKKGGIPKL